MSNNEERHPLDMLLESFFETIKHIDSDTPETTEEAIEKQMKAHHRRMQPVMQSVTDTASILTLFNSLLKAAKLSRKTREELVLRLFTDFLAPGGRK